MNYADTIAAGFHHRTSEAGERAFMGRLRSEIVGMAEGTVIEVGCGSGRNLEYYRPARVGYLYAIEPDRAAARKAAARADETDLLVEFMDTGSEQLPFEDHFADSIVATLQMCSVENPDKMAGELRRVLKPGGKLLFIEHVRSSQPWRARIQDWLTPVTAMASDNCHINRPSVDSLRGAGFRVRELRRLEMGPAWLQPFVGGVATAD